MPKVFYTKKEYNQVCRKVTNLIERNTALEQLRPAWAMGYTSESVAAQESNIALTTLWNMLGVQNQTEAVKAIQELIFNASFPGTKK